MKNSQLMQTSRRLIIFAAILGVVSVLPLLSRAQPSTSITIENNSNRSIRYVYFSHTNADDWTGNKLANGSSIGPGQSYTITNVSWDSSQVKVIGEDQDGCFLSGVVSGQSNATWTITSSTAADCGSGH